VQEHHGGCHFRIASPSPCLLLGSADWLQCEGYNWEVQAKKAHAVASSFEAPLLELNAQSMQPHVSLLLQTFQITWTIWHSLPTNCRDLCEVEKDYWSTIRGTQDKYKDNRSNLELHWKLFNSIKKSLSGCLATFRPWFSLAGDCASSMSQAKWHQAIVV